MLARDLIAPTTGLRQRSTRVASASIDKKYAEMPREERDQATKYILVGYKNEFDPTKSSLHMSRLDIAGRDVYGVSLTTIMPTEFFYILDVKLGYKRRFYPQGNRSLQFTRALEGDEKRGHNKPWVLANVKPGTQLSIFFAPSEGSLAWSCGPLDQNFVMPPPKEELSAEDILAATQFQVDNSIQTNILLMAADPLTKFVLAVFHVVPHLIMLLLLIWVMQSAHKQTKVSIYHADKFLEWINVFIIYFAIVMTRAFDVGDNVTAIQEAFALANKVHDNEALARGLRIGAAFEFINLLQDPIAFLLSLYVAVFLSDDVFLNVLLNAVALEFVTEIDEAMVSAFTRWRFSEGAAISFALLDVTYGVDEEFDLWHKSSDSSSEKVHEDLSKGIISNGIRWQLLTSRTKGLGLLDTMEDGREVVLSLKLQLDIVNWSTMPEQKLTKHGGLYLAATTNEIWEHHISKRQRALLLRHFPDLAVKFPWFGSVNLETGGFGFQHAPFIAQIANMYARVTAVSCWFDNLGDASVAVLRDGLMKNRTLKCLALCHCGLTDVGAIDIAKLLRENSILESCYLIDNRGIGDTGALSLAAALSEGEDANSTLHRIIMGLNNVSTACQERCVQMTNGRMEFFPDESPLCAYFLSLPRGGMSNNNPPKSVSVHSNYIPFF